MITNWKNNIAKLKNPHVVLFGFNPTINRIAKFIIVLILGGSINDCRLDYYLANGATSGHINDAAYEFLTTQTGLTTHVSDMWYVYLTSQGFSGTVGEMKKEFWLTTTCGQI